MGKRTYHVRYMEVSRKAKRIAQDDEPLVQPEEHGRPSQFSSPEEAYVISGRDNGLVQDEHCIERSVSETKTKSPNAERRVPDTATIQ